MSSKLLRFGALVAALAGPATAQVAFLQIHILEGEGSVYAPGSRAARPLTVEVTDDTGKPVAGAAVSFHLPDEGATGVFGNGLRTEIAITDARGRASARAMTLSRVPGRFEIRVVASKEQARAGVVSFQYIAEPHRGAALPAAMAPASPGPRASSSRRLRWIAIVALAAGGAAAGILSAARSGSTSPAVSNPSTVTIGPPSTTVLKP